MERSAACESGDLTTREVEAPSVVGARTAKPASIMLGSAAPLTPMPSVELPEIPREIPDSELRISPSARLLDISFALCILILVLPLMGICALAIRLGSPGSAIFRQVRLGRGGREFTCLKFRTMSQGAEPSLNAVLGQDGRLQEEWASVYKLHADPRVTPLGRFMRRYSIDELPQLFNVLRGEMSVVGPRPIVSAEIHRYGERYDDYCKVNPGITGLWEVSGRHALSYDERVRLDAEYANNKSV